MDGSRPSTFFEVIIVLQLSKTYEKLHCKGEPYQFISDRDPSVHKKRQKNTQTKRLKIIVLLLYTDFPIE